MNYGGLLRFLALAVVVAMFVPGATAEMVLYYSFNEIDGDAVMDLSGKNNNGILENNPKVIDGVDGAALEFSSSRVKVMASDSLTGEIFAEGEFTLVLWINAHRTGNEWQQVFRAGTEPNDTLFINNDGRLSWRGWVGGAWAGGMCETDPGVVPADTWTHAAVVSDAVNFRVYVNGELSKETNFQQTRGANTEYVIGGYAGGESYSGAVDELAIFTEPLSEADIQGIMDVGVMNYLAVDPKGKLATQWAGIKTSR